MDDAIAKALKRREELAAEIEKIDRYVALHRELFGTESEQTEPEKAVDKDVNRRRRGAVRPSDVADAAERILAAAGRPMARGELAEALTAAGIELAGEDKPRYLGTILWRHRDRFENIEGEGYWLRHKSPPNDALRELNALVGQDDPFKTVFSKRGE